MNSRRRVNSTVMPLTLFEKQGTSDVRTCRRNGLHRARQIAGALEMRLCGRALWPGDEWFGALHSGGA